MNYSYKICLACLVVLVLSSCSEPPAYDLHSIKIFIQFDSSSEERLLRSQSIPINKSENIDSAFHAFNIAKSKRYIENSNFESTTLIKRNIQ